jgi:hypothetical protein
MAAAAAPPVFLSTAKILIDPAGIGAQNRRTSGM